jgi:hypothetical protein
MKSLDDEKWGIIYAYKGKIIDYITRISFLVFMCYSLS